MIVINFVVLEKLPPCDPSHAVTCCYINHDMPTRGDTQQTQFLEASGSRTETAPKYVQQSQGKTAQLVA